VKHTFFEKCDEVIRSRIEYVIFIFITLLFIAVILIIIRDGPLELHRQLLIP